MPEPFGTMPQPYATTALQTLYAMGTYMAGYSFNYLLERFYVYVDLYHYSDAIALELAIDDLINYKGVE